MKGSAMNALLAEKFEVAIETPLIARLTDAAAAIRQVSIAAIYRAGSGHPGGALSCADILACLYGAEMNVWADDVHDPARDRFVMSKGHAAPALYAAGAEFGFCDIEGALSLRKLGSPFQGHPHVIDLPWAETSTGSLGQGFSVALGMAMGLKMKGSLSRVYALLGDGEMQEGEVWEAAMCAAHHQLGNLTAIVDYNKLQSDDANANIMGLEPLALKWRAFGWQVQEIDGHDIGAILYALERARDTTQPNVIIAHTIKGKGVPYMENVPAWHGSVKLTQRQATDALRALDTDEDRIASWING
jgi:transketolase